VNLVKSIPATHLAYSINKDNIIVQNEKPRHPWATNAQSIPTANDDENSFVNGNAEFLEEDEQTGKVKENIDSKDVINNMDLDDSGPEMLAKRKIKSIAVENTIKKVDNKIIETPIEEKKKKVVEEEKEKKNVNEKRELTTKKG